MSIAGTRAALGRIFFQRCIYLFVLLLALIVLAPVLASLTRGALITNAISAFVIVSAVAAVGRSRVSFVLAILLAVPALIFHWKLLESGDEIYRDLGLKCDLALYGITLFFLIRYVFDRGVMTADRLSGAASAYLMMGVMWTFIYSLIARSDPAAFRVGGVHEPMAFVEFMYLSFVTLTTMGYGDIVPASYSARTAALMEAIMGQLFLAILIARLVGVYPQGRRAG
jgi:hypothetical protein